MKKGGPLRKQNGKRPINIVPLKPMSRWETQNIRFPCRRRPRHRHRGRIIPHHPRYEHQARKKKPISNRIRQDSLIGGNGFPALGFITNYEKNRRYTNQQQLRGFFSLDD
ncbi:hypothetical protein BWK47_07585 [Synechocystis sp. CACIAM 05]|nr:hypothetical protein BWK47_07585 [Synechocystis sp. CACIAM 05]